MIQYEIHNKKMYVGHSTTARLIVEQDIPRTEKAGEQPQPDSEEAQ